MHELTGPEALSLPETAERIARLTGRPVVHEELTVEASADGTEGFERELTLLTSERVHAGHFATVTDVVERVTGRPARTLEAFVADELVRQDP